MNNCIYKKKLCMTEFNIVRRHFDSPQYFDAGVGQINSTFVYVVKGNVTISSFGKSLFVDEGKLLFIPEGMRCSAVWRGASEIEYYSLQIISKKVDITDSAGSFALQRVDTYGIDSVGERIEEIYDLFSTDDRVNMIRALGIYYCLYADILPKLKKADTPQYSAAIAAATKFIDTNYTDDFSVEQLAAACHVSESHIYHLFRDELGTTPIKYRNTLRVERAAADLRIAGRSIDEVADRNGFHSAAYFREIFKSETGLTPTEYRRMAEHSEDKE